MESRGRELIEMAAGMQAPAKTSREGGVRCPEMLSWRLA